MNKEYNLAGISIEAGRVLVGYATMKNDLFPATMSELELDIDPNRREIFIDEAFSLEKNFDCLFRGIFEHFPNIENIGIGCYGPFTDKEYFDSPFVKNIISFTHLGKTTGGRYFSDRPLKAELKNIVDKYAKKDVGVWIETDVAIESMGYTYLFTRKKKNRDLIEKEKRTTAIIKADYGVGGTFMDMTASNAWHGVSHTEIGQINVQEWSGERFLREKRDLFRRATNPHSIEGLASIPAIVHYFEKSIEELMETPNEPVWDREAWYLAQLAWNLTCFASPNNIVFSGKIMKVPGLLDKVRYEFEYLKKTKQRSIPNYPEMHITAHFIDDYLQNLNKEDIRENPAICGTLCYSAITHVPKDMEKFFGTETHG